MFHKICLLALAGACGTLTRYGLTGVIHRWVGGVFPWGTVVVNVLGCLLFGLVWTARGERAVISPEARVVILTGFMGAFTTFSTFIAETSHLLIGTQLLMGVTNIALQLVTGIGGFILGLGLGRII
ncbi:fluoride efflux transporter FluC [Desulfobacter sp. UBA2225]|uniref:fluoride efflux transporter FluC n=1 Tax=Desulfobacter sp. UBA2225 TaxID=1961413 RepID=UPI002580C990|nr:CrcB family protein [Desulfobacter sp. UBA2225]